MWDVIATVGLLAWLMGYGCGIATAVWARAGRHFKSQSKIVLLHDGD